MVHYVAIIRWHEKQEVGGPIEREYQQDVTCDINDGATEEGLLENIGYKLQEKAGANFIEFTRGWVAPLNGYVAFFKRARIELHALNLAQAKQQALARFKPSKREANLVAVVLAEKNGETVTHHAVD